MVWPAALLPACEEAALCSAGRAGVRAVCRFVRRKICPLVIRVLFPSRRIRKGPKFQPLT